MERNFFDKMRVFARMLPGLIIYFVFSSFLAIAVGFTSDGQLLELAKALPWTVSAFVVGMFSVLFWALNSIGRSQKSEMRIKEAEKLFEIRLEYLNRVIDDAKYQGNIDIAVLRAHLLLSGGEVKAEPEVPGAGGIAFDYSDAVQAILRRS